MENKEPLIKSLLSGTTYAEDYFRLPAEDEGFAANRRALIQSQLEGAHYVNVVAPLNVWSKLTLFHLYAIEQLVDYKLLPSTTSRVFIRDCEGAVITAPLDDLRIKRHQDEPESLGDQQIHYDLVNRFKVIETLDTGPVPSLIYARRFILELAGLPDRDMLVSRLWLRFQRYFGFLGQLSEPLIDRLGNTMLALLSCMRIADAQQSPVLLLVGETERSYHEALRGLIEDLAKDLRVVPLYLQPLAVGGDVLLEVGDSRQTIKIKLHRLFRGRRKADVVEIALDLVRFFSRRAVLREAEQDRELVSKWRDDLYLAAEGSWTKFLDSVSEEMYLYLQQKV